MPKKRKLKSYEISSKTKNPKIDSEKQIIYDVVLCQAGEAKGHGEWLEPEFLEDMVGYAQSELNDSVPCYFGHNYDNLGKQLATIQNIRLSSDGNQALGDLHIYKSADNSPKLPNMGSWVMQLAEEDKTAINLSIKFKAAGYYQKNKKGEKITVDWATVSAKNKVFVEFKSLISCDVVDKGAATETLYSKKKKSAKAIFWEMGKKIFGIEEAPALSIDFAQRLKSAKAKTQKYKKKFNKALAERDQLTQELAELQIILSKKEKKISELKKKPVGEHTSGRTSTKKNRKSKFNCAVTAKAHKTYQSINKTKS